MFFKPLFKAQPTSFFWDFFLALRWVTAADLVPVNLLQSCSVSIQLQRQAAGRGYDTEPELWRHLDSAAEEDVRRKEGQTEILGTEEGGECFSGEAWCCVNISSDVTAEGKNPCWWEGRAALIRENALSVFLWQ